MNAANASALARTLAAERDDAFLFRDLATLRTDIDLFKSVDDLRWAGPLAAGAAFAARFDAAVTDKSSPRDAGGKDPQD